MQMKIFQYALQASAQGSSGLLMWLGFCAAALLVVMGLVVFSLLRRKRQKKTDMSV